MIERHSSTIGRGPSAISGAATTMATAVPALMMSIGGGALLDREPLGDARVAAGKPPPSPMPSRNRLSASVATLVASPWLAQASN